MSPGFAQFVRAAAGHDPYPYQCRLAEQGLPELLSLPTGAGKTLAAALPWLYRRRFHPDELVRQGTPRGLVIVLPQRALVEQTYDAIEGWLAKLGLTTEVGLHRLMGGASTDDRLWQTFPARDAIVVGTQDMVLSRLLMRGYAEPRAAWPVAFGLLHAGTQFVFDEVQLMGPGLNTSLQLEGLRRTLATSAGCRTMWMSATPPTDLATADYPGPASRVELGEEDRAGPLRQRLIATRRIVEADVDPKRYAESVAADVLARHRPGTRTIAVFNTVERARLVHAEISKARPAVLLHSRFRPRDRADRLGEARATPGGDGTVVVTTQVLEAGVDIDSALLFTETAPWSSIVQRAGRCNRAGAEAGATLLWAGPPPGKTWAAPYEDKDLTRTADALTALSGQEVTSTDLQDRPVEQERPAFPVLRRRDLVDLFDTAPDLSGNDLDVERWIRDADEATVHVAWRPVDTDGPGPHGPDADAARPARDELCPVPVAEIRPRIGTAGWRAWLFDQRDAEWRPTRREDVRPGAVLVLDAAQGHYTPERGWDPASTAPVPPITPAEAERPDGFGSDPLTATGRWYPLAEHLEDVRREVHTVLDEFGDLPGIDPALREAAATAGLYHDIGKAHEVFAESLSQVATPPATGGPWAKSPGTGRIRHSRPHFRHELVSALAVGHPDSGLLDGAAEPDLVAYLVAAHHGKVRLTVRAMPNETGGRVLGVAQADHLPPVGLSDGRTTPALALDLSPLAVGNDSWQARAIRLRDRLGVFRLAFLEAVVRIADWRASEQARRQPQEAEA